MRTNLLSVIIGGLLVAGGYVLGAADGLRTSDAGVAFDSDSQFVVTSGDGAGSLVIWHRSGADVTKATSYRLDRGPDGEQPRLVWSDYVPEAPQTDR